MPTRILDPLKIPKSVKADAFDAYHAAGSAGELKTRLAKLPLAHATRAALHQHKFGAAINGTAAKTALRPPAGGLSHKSRTLRAAIQPPAETKGQH